MSWLIKFLKELADAPHLLRPPGALPEEDFLKRCIKCIKCVQVCPYRSIKTIPVSWGLKYGTPAIVARETPCYVCMKCPPVCPTGALDNKLTEKQNIRMGVAEINRELCLAYNGVICRACFERCPIYREAIILKEEMYPEVQREKCLGCGICENVCPTIEAAVRVVSVHSV